MRHRRTVPKLQRTAAHRDAMLRTMVTDFLRHERVRTTQAKAKALRRVAEKLITMGKKESLHARRNAARIIRDKSVVKKLFDEIAPRYAERPGGYTRIVKLPARSGDAADMAVIELVEAELERKPRRKKPKRGPRTAAQDAEVAAATRAGSGADVVEESQQSDVESAPPEETSQAPEDVHETADEKMDEPPGKLDPEGEPEEEDK